MPSLRLPVIDHVILFGGAPLLRASARMLRELGFRVDVYTSPRHVAEPLDETGLTLGQALNADGVPFVSTDDIDREASLPDRIGPGTLGIGMGEAWSFGPPLIARFGGRLLDFMGIPLPRYRGGAHYTWMILRGERNGACNLQVINEEMIQGERDTGELVKTRRYRFPETARIPQDYFDAAVREETAFIREFLEDVKAGVTFDLRLPNEEESLFFPRLHTLRNGWIDWSWSGHDIERFVCAFDAPYAGASTRINGVRHHLRGARLDPSEGAFHPFQSGIITRITEAQGIVVATTSGLLHLAAVVPAKGEQSPPPRVGDRLFTPRVDIERALDERVTYGTS